MGLINKPSYQVVVELKNGKYQRVAPKMCKESAEMLAHSIKNQLKRGREKHWHNPQVIQQ